MVNFVSDCFSTTVEYATVDKFSKHSLLESDIGPALAAHTSVRHEEDVGYSYKCEQCSTLSTRPRLLQAALMVRPVKEEVVESFHLIPPFLHGFTHG